MSFATVRRDELAKPQLYYQPSFSPQLFDDTGRYLFHHYVNIVSSRMMPFEDDRNPWKAYYPSLALSETSLAHVATKHAILSQAAAHLQHLGCEPDRMKMFASSHYSTALRALSQYRSNSSDEDFGTVIACILSLMMAEVYMGVSAAWRVHLTSAWRLAVQALPFQPWRFSEMTWLATQSLCFVKMRMSISERNLSHVRVSNNSDNSDHTDDLELEPLIQSVSYRHDFGFTLGASATSAAGLSQALCLIRSFQEGPITSKLLHSVKILTTQLLCSLNFEETSPPSLSHLHSHIFTFGVIVFLNRQTINPPPYELLPYVQNLFLAVRQFECLCSETPTQVIRRSVADITLWPIFVAAMECFREEEMKIARRWMQNVSTSGIGNRKDVIGVVTKVWETREELRQACALEFSAGHNWNRSNELLNLNDHELKRGWIRVSWQEVMRSQGVDLLLI